MQRELEHELARGRIEAARRVVAPHLVVEYHLDVVVDGTRDMTHMQGKMLAFLARHPGATQSELVQHSGRDKAQLARMVRELREQGLLIAEPDASDRRSVRLRLTSDGQAVQRTLHRQGVRLRAQAVAGLSAQERAQLVALLQRVQRNLEALARS